MHLGKAEWRDVKQQRRGGWLLGWGGRNKTGSRDNVSDWVIAGSFSFRGGGGGVIMPREDSNGREREDRGTFGWWLRRGGVSVLRRRKSSGTDFTPGWARLPSAKLSCWLVTAGQEDGLKCSAPAALAAERHLRRQIPLAGHQRLIMYIRSAVAGLLPAR